jgi:tripartite-type tricarboxylate transporter receptor subunit TctC
VNVTALSRFAVCIASLAAASAAFAQSPYPARAITMVVPYSTGGSTDIITRLIAKELTGQLGRQVVVENRVGGGGVIGWSSVARAAADGYTLLATELSFAIAPGLLSTLPFDARKGFQQVATATSVPHVLVITPSLPVRNVKELIGLAKARPGELNFGSGGSGTNTHLGSELLKNLAGINMVHIPYKGAGAVLADLMSGQVQVLISAAPTVLPHIASHRLRALMVTDDKRAATLPEVPSAKEAGLPRMVMYFWVGYSLPAGTPQPIIERLNKEIATAVTAPGTKARFAELGVNAVGNTPEQATKLVDDEMDRWQAVIKKSGITAQ